MKPFWNHAALILIPLLGLAGTGFAQTSYSLLSPDKRIEVTIRTGERFSYDVLFKGTPLLQNSTFSIDIDHNTLGLQPKVKTAKERSYDGTLEPPVRQKFARVRENYNELRLTMEGNYAVVFRAYNEGVAYRLETSLPQTEVKVYSEEASFNFPDDYRVFYPLEESFFSHNERHYLPMNLKTIAPTAIASCPRWSRPRTALKLRWPNRTLRTTPAFGCAAQAAMDWRPPSLPIRSRKHWKKTATSRSREAADYIAVTRGTRSLSLAIVWHCRKGWRSDHQSTGLASGQAVAGPGHFLDQARQSGLGLVERSQPLGRRLQVWSQHPDLQVLRGFRRQVWTAVHHPR